MHMKTLAVSCVLAPLLAAPCAAAQIRASSEYPEFYNGDDTRGIDFVQSIKVLSPPYRSDVKGDVKVSFEAPGMTRVIARCWKHDGGWGHDEVLADIALGEDSRGGFVFRADSFPNGPMTVRIQAMDGNGHQDYCELQLYNLGGVKWKQGLPKSHPAGANGMKLVFADDFDRPLSISPDGRGARYAAHKTGGGDFSGWPFSDPDGDCNPFGQQGSYLRIHASKPEGTAGRTGIISSIRSDGTGVAVPVPAYFECRLMCHSAPGSWGAFWTLTKGTIGMRKDDPRYAGIKKAGCDELDVIECYGGYGPRNPNHGGRYGVTSHWWGQPDMGEAPHAFPDAMQMAGGSSWSWTFHDYGLAITETDTVYYFDGVEVLRHPTGPVTKSQDTWFLINYAIAGISGWPYDLERYGNESDMWIDWVRVYCGKGARFLPCEPWGYAAGDGRMHRGGVCDSPVAVRHVPFAEYDLVVYLGAGINGWSGDVELVRPNGAEIASYAVNFGWIGENRYVEASRGRGTDSDAPDSVAVFRGISSQNVAVRVRKRGGKGEAAIAALQIVPRRK